VPTAKWSLKTAVKNQKDMFLAVVIFQTDSFSVDVQKREIWRWGIDLDLIAHIFPMIFCYSFIAIRHK
jgi:hypothetical protein